MDFLIQTFCQESKISKESKKVAYPEKPSDGLYCNHWYIFDGHKKKGESDKVESNAKFKAD